MRIFTLGLLILIYQNSFSQNQEIKPNPRFGFVTTLKIDNLPKDYSEFKSILGKENIEVMNNNDANINFEIASTYKNYYAGLGFGFSFIDNYDNDSIEIEFNTTQYVLTFGYNKINTERIIIRPELAIKWYRSRLINNDSEREISIEKYVEDRDLDIRFNQMTGYVGLNFAYKIYKNNMLATDFWTVGFYFGYSFKLNKNTWVYSKRNRLETNETINIERYNLGIYISFNIE